MEYSLKEKNIPVYNNTLYNNFQYNNKYRGNYFRGGRNRGRNIYHNGYRNESNYFPENIYPFNPKYNHQFNNSYNSYIQNNSKNRMKKYISMAYPHLIDINTKNSNILKEINTDCKFFIIKSFTEEDIHKSIKYGVWSSSAKGNKTLSEAFKNTKEKDSFVYLFFSCNNSGRYVGVAKMKSDCDFNKKFEFWTQDNKWMGLFDVEWIFIKDVPMKEFKNIIISMNYGVIKPILYAQNTQEIPYEEARNMLNIFEKYENINSILEQFEYYDIRQNNYELNKQMQQK